tara:strand:+ start:936 stop:1217 length:282 start_codon:yes stop_codon:yes gene_type:complete
VKTRKNLTKGVKVKALIQVTLKNEVLDPQGKAVQNSLKSLGFRGIKNVRQGKLIEIELQESNIKIARESLDEMCNKLLANPVIENYRIEISED